MNWKVVLLSIFICVIEGVIYLISWELAAGSSVLVLTIASIWLILRKSYIVEENSPAITENRVLTPPYKINATETVQPLPPLYTEDRNPVNSVLGVDSSVFAQFRNQVNLKAPPSQNPTPYPANSPVVSSAATAYGNNAPKSNQSDSFSNELEDIEQIRVTLSKAVKALKETGQKVQQTTDHNNLSRFASQPSPELMTPKLIPSKPLENIPFMEQTSAYNPVPVSTPPAPFQVTKKEETEFPDYPFKQETKQPATFEEPLVDEEDDLFADALIPLPGGETLIQKDPKSDSPVQADNISISDSSDFDEGLGSFLKKPTHLEEHTAEAEGLLKIATASCESGRWDDAKASLDSYLQYLNEIGQKPSTDVLTLYNQLEQANVSSVNMPDDLTNVNRNIASKTTSQRQDSTADYESVMKELVSALEEKHAYDEVLPLLEDLMNYNRQRVNLVEMDKLYEKIEKAHIFLNQNEQLVNSYKEHLSIKQQIQDSNGEIKLLSKISLYYAQTGDMEASKRYQTESLRLAKNMVEKESFPVS